jgi:branched-chain amino acid transport system substrate-binding protein
MHKLATVAATLFGMVWSPANAEMNGATRIGVLNDMSSVYSDFQGPGSVVAAQMAAEEFAKHSKRKVEILSADHQNKPDIGAEIARRWFDVEGVDMIIDVPNSAVALAVADIARDKNKVFIGSGAGTALLTGAKCSPNTVHWTYDTWSMGHGVARGLLQQGGKTWFFVTADYAFGDDLQKQASEEVSAACAIRSAPTIFRRSSYKRRRHGPRSSGSPMPAVIPSTPSSRPASSISAPNKRSWR